MFDETGQISRLTFEEVQKNQDILMRLIRDKLEKGIPLTEEERENFDAIYARATLGFGVDQLLEPNANDLNDNTCGGLGGLCLDAVIEYAMEYDIIPVRRYGDSKSRRYVTKEELWRKIRKTLRGHVFGKALQLAVKLSPEKEWGKISAGVRGR